jgi:hypothetical protein
MTLNSRKRRQIEQDQLKAFNESRFHPLYEEAKQRFIDSHPHWKFDPQGIVDALRAIGVMAPGSVGLRISMDVNWKRNLLNYVVG